MKPILVSAQSIDFAVMTKVAERLSPQPVGKSISGEPGVRQGECRLHIRMAQVREILIELLGREHALVGHGAS